MRDCTFRMVTMAEIHTIPQVSTCGLPHDSTRRTSHSGIPAHSTVPHNSTWFHSWNFIQVRKIPHAEFQLIPQDSTCGIPQYPTCGIPLKSARFKMWNYTTPFLKFLNVQLHITLAWSHTLNKLVEFRKIPNVELHMIPHNTASFHMWDSAWFHLWNSARFNKLEVSMILLKEFPTIPQVSTCGIPSDSTRGTSHSSQASPCGIPPNSARLHMWNSAWLHLLNSAISD